jgi:outer membrane protein insertion porin family
MQKNAIVVLILSALTMGLAAARAAEDPNAAGAAEPSGALAERADIIKSIEFEGNVKFKDHVLRQRLGFELGDRLDPFLAEGGRLTIAEVYRKVGYTFVEVSLDRDRLARGNLLYLVAEGPRVQVDSITFTGNKAMGSGTLAKVIKTTERKWLLWPFYYTEDAIEEDLGRLREFYYDRGYLDYKIEAKTEFADDRSGVRVTFTIDEGPVFRIGAITFAGNARFTEDQLRARMELSEGQIYLKPAAGRDATELMRVYREEGFVDAEVRQRPKFTLDSNGNLVTVGFDIVEGKRYRIGRIDVTGNEQTRDKVVRRVLDEYGFTPEQWYNGRVAPKEGGGLLETYVKRVAVAEEALIRPVAASDPNSDYKDVRVDIKEGSTGMIMPGIGISSDSGVIGRLIYRQQNFDIGDWPDDPSGLLTPWRHFKGAGQSFSITLEPGTEYSQYYVQFSDPYWRDRPITFDLMGRSWERYRESHDEGRLKGYVGFEQRLKGRWRRSLGLRAENVKVSDLDFDAPQEIRDVAGDHQLFGVRLGVGETNVDNRYTPAKGHVVSAGYEQVAGDFTFGILEGSFIKYFTLREDVLGRKTVLAGKILAGTVVGDAPPFEKFYAGGSTQYGMRGFEYRGVSTRGLQVGPEVVNPVYRDPIGSDWIFLANAEVTIPMISENFAAVFFVDSGTIDSGSYRLSGGGGIQIMVPQFFGNMPMRFELGVPLLRDEQDETQIFSFSAAGMF